jgi:RND family efflux transporter MFP subunit
MKPSSLYRILLVLLVLLAPLAATSTFGGSSESTSVVGVTAPSEEIDLAFPEVGIIAEIAVEEGDVVTKGQLLAALDSSIHEAQAKVARIKAESSAAVSSAEAEYSMREHRLAQLRQIGAAHTNPDEVARAEVEQVTALSHFQLAQEEAAQAKLALETLEVEIERRQLRSPIDGVVTRIFRDVAESVGGVETLVMTVVNLDELDLVVHVATELAEQLHEGDEVMVERSGTLSASGLSSARVVFISPVVDASSSTRRVRLGLDNRKREHVSGVKYLVRLDP